jgi:hypothetical protein
VGSDRSYLAALEFQRAQVARKFGLKLPPLARIYLYPDVQTMARLTNGGCGGQAGETGCTSPFDRPPTVQEVIRAVYHEPIHVYELAMQPRPRMVRGEVLYQVAPLFIAEGTAVALEDREADPRLSDYCSDLSYAPLDDCARIAARHMDPFTILGDYGFRAADAGYAYSLGGSFVKYLMLRYGYRVFGRFYYELAAQPTDHLSDYDVATRAIYKAPAGELIHAWLRSLCSGAC